MEPHESAPIPNSRLPASGTQTASYLPWLKIEVALRMALTYPWDAWAEVRQHIPWLLAEQSRIRRAGWFN